MKIFLLGRGLSSDDMFRFSDINVDIQRKNESINKKIIINE